MTVKNASTLPRRYFGLHMAEGVAEYQEKTGAYRILVNESTIKDMDPTFEGRPVYVDHVDEVDVAKVQTEADGYVVRSFFNKADGKHWVEFLVVSDRGHEAIRNKWKLSNAYVPKDFAGGGQWHGVEYQKEVTRGEYEHLAIVKNPRYAESIILTPEEFKLYNENKEIVLRRLANSQGDKSVFKFFKREKIENSVDLSNSVVLLPESKKEMAVEEALKVADKFLNMNGYAAPEHMVKVGNEEMSVGDLANKYCDMVKANEVAAEEKKKNEEEKPKEEEKKENEEEEKKEEKKEEPKKNHLEALKNAAANAQGDQSTVDLNKTQRGKARYGSKK